MVRKKTTKVQLSPLYMLYLDKSQYAESVHEAMRENITPALWDELANKISNKEIVNWAVRGEVATGKSTVAAKIMYEGNKYLHKLGMFNNKSGKRKMNKINMMKYIMSDQTEFLRFANKGYKNRFIQIDEYNRLAEGGINATSEANLYDYYSEVFAQKFVHRISCAPSIINDRNATVILDVIGKNVKEEMTRVKVTYRNPVDWTTLVLGYADIYVGDIINLKWYAKYREKKFKRMELLDKHGVRDIRELEFAGHVLNAYTELLPLARTGKFTLGVINATVSKVIRKKKMIYSLIAMNEVASRVTGLLELTKEKYNLLRQKEKQEQGTTRTSPNPIKAQQIEESINIIGKGLSNLLEEEEEKRRLYEDFLKIE